MQEAERGKGGEKKRWVEMASHSVRRVPPPCPIITSMFALVLREKGILAALLPIVRSC